MRLIYLQLNGRIDKYLSIEPAVTNYIRLNYLLIWGITNYLIFNKKIKRIE